MPADWTVTATPVAILGQPTVSGNGDPTSAGGVNAVAVRAGDYDLSESGPDGVHARHLGLPGRRREPDHGHGAGQRQRDLPDHQPGHRPSAHAGQGRRQRHHRGHRRCATDWTLSAGGPTPISGATGSASVTNALVAVGTYTLSESGPPGYTAGAWSCVGGSAAGNQVTLAEGQTATCTIVNTADPGVWELTKLADPPSGTTVDPGSVITYTLIAAHESGSPISGAYRGRRPHARCSPSPR